MDRNRIEANPNTKERLKNQIDLKLQSFNKENTGILIFIELNII